MDLGIPRYDCQEAKDALKAIYDEAEATQTTPDKDAIAATSDLCTPFFKDENGNSLVKNLIVPTVLVAILATFVAIMFFEVEYTRARACAHSPTHPPTYPHTHTHTHTHTGLRHGHNRAAAVLHR